MSILVNTLYAILTWTTAFVVGFDGQWAWLGWSLLAMAVLQSWAVMVTAVRSA